MAISEVARRARQERARRIRRNGVPGVHTATVEEGKQLFDYQTRKELGISGEEFLRRWDAGMYRNLTDSPEDRKIQYLAMLTPLPAARRPKSAVDASLRDLPGAWHRPRQAAQSDPCTSPWRPWSRCSSPSSGSSPSTITGGTASNGSKGLRHGIVGGLEYAASVTRDCDAAKG